MAKRGAANQITQENWDKEDEEEVTLECVYHFN